MNNATNNIDRQFIRHPSDIPIEYCLRDIPEEYNITAVKDVSVGGLSFYSKAYITPSQWLHLYIPVNENYFEADAKVLWCNQGEDQKNFHVGVSFTTDTEAYSARMVEQVCHIEHYKKEVFVQEGRELSSDQAAAEWITKYATDFPQV